MSSYAGWRLNESIVRDGFKVSVNGIGADEVFSGYYDHHNAYLADMHRMDPVRHAEAEGEWSDTAGKYVRNPFLQDPRYLISRPTSRNHIFLDAAHFSSMLCSPFHEPFAEMLMAESLLKNRMANELTAEAVPVLLHEDDLNAMYHSLENRAPFLDSKLFEWTTLVPTRHLVKGGRAKAVLRAAVSGIAPEAVVNNPRKVGFNTPIGMFLDLRSPGTAAELLSDSPILSIVDRDRMHELMGADSLPNSRSKFLFNFVSTKLFLEEFPP
jgi:asparagine synthase (glutamine-hydrolysing)